MRFIKLALISLLLFCLGLLGLSLFIPSRLIIPKSIDINADRGTIMAVISDPIRWKQWYPGADSMNVLYSNKIATGLVLDPETGESILLTGISDTLVSAELKGRQGRTIKTYWHAPGTGQPPVKLYWYMEFRTKWYPWQKFASLMYEKVYGTQMEKGLIELKNAAETARQ